MRIVTQVLKKEERNPFPSLHSYKHSYKQNCAQAVGMRQIRSGDRAMLFTTFRETVLRENKKFSDCIGIANYVTSFVF